LKGFNSGSSKITFTGKWSTGTSAVWWGGSTRFSRADGARARLRFNGREIVWVGATGPDRGVARIYVDGVLLRSIDLGLLEGRAIIVFRKKWSTAATRTIEVRVMGSPNSRPRVDLDGFVVLD
jgi:hypothetical protein